MITIVCKYCGKTRINEVKTGPKPNYCSGRSCRDKHYEERRNNTLADIKCLICKKPLTKAQVKHGQKYCSYQCSGIANRSLKNQNLICIVCGIQFVPKKKGQQCCSLLCSKKAGGSTLRNNLEFTKAICSQCGQEFDYPILTGIANETKRCSVCSAIHERDRSRQRRLITKKQCIETINDVEVFERDSWICRICNEPVDSGLFWPNPLSPSLDHIVPISKGGLHEYSNVQLAHLGCNSRKAARYEARA